MKAKQIIISGILAGFVILIISQIVNYFVAMLLPYTVLSLGGMRPVNDPIMLLFFLFPFVISFAMAIAYSKISSAFSGNWKSKGFQFGSIAWLLYALPSIYVVFTSMDYPLGFTISRIAGSLIYLFAAALIVAKFSE